jgi:tetratricopeptide (TPR) repeat protein
VYAARGSPKLSSFVSSHLSGLPVNKVDRVSWISRTFLVTALFCCIPATSAAQVSNHTGENAAQYAVSIHQLRVPARVRAHLEKADGQFKSMNLSAAAREVSQALRLDPGCAQALTMSALIRLASRDFPGAADDAQRSTLLDANDAQSFLVLGSAYNSLREFDRAEVAEQQALKIAPTLWQARLELAKAFYGQSRPQPALDQLDLLSVDFPDVHLVRGHVLMLVGRTREGARELLAFADQAPNDPRATQIRATLAKVPSSDNAIPTVR